MCPSTPFHPARFPTDSARTAISVAVQIYCIDSPITMKGSVLLLPGNNFPFLGRTFRYLCRVQVEEEWGNKKKRSRRDWARKIESHKPCKTWPRDHLPMLYTVSDFFSFSFKTFFFISFYRFCSIATLCHVNGETSSHVLSSWKTVCRESELKLAQSFIFTVFSLASSAFFFSFFSFF